jgi:hypothetical protein
MALALVRPVGTFRPQKHCRSRMGNMSMLSLPCPEDQSRLLEKMVVLTVLEPLWRYMLIGRNDAELLESVGWSKQQSTRLLGTEEIVQT